MKTIYIDSKVLEEGALLKALPDELLSVVEKQKTAFGNNPAFPDIYDDDFVSIICKKRFDELTEKLRQIGKIDFISSTDINQALGELINKTIEIETPVKDKLEKICVNRVIDLFKIPDDMIVLEAKLTNDIEIDGNGIQVEKIKDYKSEPDSIDFMEQIRSEVHKRRVINALCMGAGMEFSTNIKELLPDLYDINPRLPELYRDIILLNSYLMFSKLEAGITDKNRMQLGTVEVKLNNPDNKVEINAQGKVFPILLSELIRGMMELFATHGLPKETAITREILGRADYLKAEEWDMRVGKDLWNSLMKAIPETKTELIPYIFKRICQLNVDDFNRLMKNVFAKTKEGKNLMSYVRHEAEEDYKDADTKNTASKIDINKSVITDEFLREEEL